MSRDKYYFHKANKSGLTKLVKVCQNAEVNIYSNITDGNYKILLTKNGIYRMGEIINNIKVYYDSNEGNFYIAKEGADNQYLNIEVNCTSQNGYSSIDYEENFDSTNYTLLEPLNIINYPINKIEYSDTSGGTFTYQSINRNVQYQSFASIIVLTARNSNGTTLNGVYLINKTNEADTTVTYTITPITTTGNTSYYTLTSTSRGFEITPNTQTTVRYKIVEIACGSQVY